MTDKNDKIVNYHFITERIKKTRIKKKSDKLQPCLVYAYKKHTEIMLKHFVYIQPLFYWAVKFFLDMEKKGGDDFKKILDEILMPKEEYTDTYGENKLKNG